MTATLNPDGTYNISDTVSVTDISGNTVNIPQSLGNFTVVGLQTDQTNLTNMLNSVNQKLAAISALSTVS
jgi:hypothetical protein